MAEDRQTMAVEAAAELMLIPDIVGCAVHLADNRFELETTEGVVAFRARVEGSEARLEVEFDRGRTLDVEGDGG